VLWFLGALLSLHSSSLLDATSRVATCNLKKLQKKFHSKVNFNPKPPFWFIKHCDFLALFFGTVLFQALSFLGIVSRHYAFSSVVVFQSCFYALCFLKHHGFSTLFMAIMLSQALWFLNIVSGHCVFSSVVVFQYCLWAMCFLKHYGFSTLFLGINAFSNTLVFQSCFSALWLHKNNDFMALFFQHYIFSSMVFSWLYS
jgi:hypothetical protein